MHNNITFLHSDNPRKASAEPIAPHQAEGVREWSGIERTVNNHLLAGLGAARRDAPRKNKRAPAGRGHSASSRGSYAGTWSQG